MTPAFIIMLVGLCYVVFFWVFSLLRREVPSAQVSYEGLTVTGLAVIAVHFSNIAVQPVYFLALLYLVTMRTRLLVELGNRFSKSKHHRPAQALYRTALKLYPDRLSRLIVLINQSASHLEQAEFATAVEILEAIKPQVLEQLGPKYRAACCYNLGSAYRRSGRHQEALRLFNEIIIVYPFSIYARLSEKSRRATLEESGIKSW